MSELFIKVISEPSDKDPFLVIYKPHNLPSAPLVEGDANNALFQASKIFPEINQVTGRKPIEKGLIHRLDTVTSGLILIATDQNFYEKMLQVQRENNFIKYYKAKSAVCVDNGCTLGGFPENPVQTDFLKCNDIVYTKSYFRSFGKGQKEVRPVTENSGSAALKKLKNPVEYETEIKICSLDKEKKQASVLCRITKGYRHQVRCHLAWAGLPVINDPLYNSMETKINGCSNEKEIMFEACAFEFLHPLTNEIKRYSVD